MGFDLPNKHISDGGILGVAPVVSFKVIMKDLEADLMRICLCLVWLGLIPASFCCYAAAADSLNTDMLFSKMAFWQ